jgi:hypothetical protein
MNEKLNSITNELFSHNAVEILDGGDTTDALYDALVEKANNVINEYGWNVVFESWKNFMYENCNSVENALNFATWFEIYGGHNHKIAEPYKFLAYLYDIFDLNPVKYNAQIMDDVSYGLLEAAGIKKNLWSDDCYTTENDPELVNAVKELRKERNQ